MRRKAKTIAKSGGYTKKGNKISEKELYIRYSKHGQQKGNFLTYVGNANKEYEEAELIEHVSNRHMAMIRRALKHSSGR